MVAKAVLLRPLNAVDELICGLILKDDTVAPLAMLVRKFTAGAAEVKNTIFVGRVLMAEERPIARYDGIMSQCKVLIATSRSATIKKFPVYVIEQTVAYAPPG